jgi:flagellar hook-length control protein FliK
MSALPITPPTPARAGSAPRSSSSPPPGSSGDFAALLDQTSARTAPAEGPKNRPAQTESRNRDAAAPKDDNKASVAADEQAVAQTPQAPAASGAVTDPKRGLAPAVADPAQDPAAAGVPAAPGQALAPVGGQAVTAAATPGLVAPGAAAGTPQPAAEAQPSEGTAQPAAGKLQIPAELLDAKGGQAKDFKNGDQPHRDLPPAPTLPPTADAAATPATATAAAPTPTPAEPGAPAPAPAAAPQAQPVATPQPTVAVTADGAPRLSRAAVAQTAERIEELVHIATTRAGNARAILQLRPAELGQVDVHLRTTREGLVATISAHEQIGLDALQQAGDELRRTLADKGVQLHSLDLQLGTGDNSFSNQGDAREASSGRRGAAASHGLDGDDTLAADELTTTHALSTPAGALVDVQA